MSEVRLPEAPMAVLPSSDLSAKRSDGRRLLTWILASLFCAGGYALAILAEFQRKGEPTGTIGHNIYDFLQVNYEPLPLLALVGFCMVAAYLTRRDDSSPAASSPSVLPTRGLRPALPIAVVLLGGLGTMMVHRNFGLSIDEYLSTWQAAVFRSGHIFAPVPERWQSAAPAMTTIFLMHDPEQHRWISCFLPVYSALRAAFALLNLESMTNAFLGGGSVLALFGVGRNLWGREADSRVLCAGALLAVSPQFLINGMTSFSWPAHLCLNLAWLYGYTSPRRRLFWLTPVVGILAMGLHQPHVHALFAAPFMVRFLLQKRWGAFSYFAGLYAMGAALWMGWLRMARPGFVSGGFEGVFAFPGVEALPLQWSNLALLMAWCSPLLLVLAGFAIARWCALPAFARDLALGILFTFGFYVFFPHNQGHGWGYRFAHGILGNVALLAVFGMPLAEAWCSRLQLRKLVLASLVFSLVCQLPYRCWEVRRVVSPFADSFAYIKSQPEDIVIIDALALWYSGDLVRNAPSLDDKPAIFFGYRLDQEKLARLQQLGSVRIVGENELARFGMFPTHLREMSK